LKNERKPSLEAGKEEGIRKGRIRKNYDDYDDLNPTESEAEDINIDEYLSNDDTPDYKTQANNYSDDEEGTEYPLAAPVSFHQDLINQLNTFILNDDERDIAEFRWSIDDMGSISRSSRYC
jgi:RNA polymerase sigma-54 factor